jgi:hypothetical protein
MAGMRLFPARPRAGFSLRAALRTAAACCVLALAGGCAQMVPQTVALRTAWPEGVARSVELEKVPFFPQDDYQCGPAALATVLAHSGVHVTPEPLVGLVYLPARQGSLQLEMLAGARRFGRISYAIEGRYADLLREVAAGNPVVVLQDVGAVGTQWHYAVVYGFDYPSGTIYLRSGTTARQEMSFTAFERSWVKSGYWAMVTVAPDRIPATATHDGWIEAVLAMARAGDAPAVTQAYATALKRWPGSLPAAIGLANQHHARGALMEAAAVLRRALQRHPDSVILLNNLAQTLSDQGRNGEALAQINRIKPQDQGALAGEIEATRKLIAQRLSQQRAGAR